MTTTPSTPSSEALQAAGEHGRDVGMLRAATGRGELIQRGQVAMLDALFASADGTATIDDATADLAVPYGDGGHWRGTVTRALAAAGIIAPAGVARSLRPSRHRGYITRWRLIDRRAAMALRDRLAEASNTKNTPDGGGRRGCI
ncbi:MAG: hypothetical protein KatS3mg111_0387 [Pirellulaceae bacterium]|nr:MAG: hypothetical protein KatS3mg111_0387 [Pirellulaceae bacterium]